MKHCSTCTCTGHERKLISPDPEFRRCGAGIDQFVHCERPEDHEGDCWNSCWGWDGYEDHPNSASPEDVNLLHSDLECNQSRF